MKMSVRVKVAVVCMLILVAVIGFYLVPGDQTIPLTRDDLVGVPWLRQFETSPEAFDGFCLKPDGRLLFINIFSMTGDSWELEGSRLTLSSHTGRYPEPVPTDYVVRKEEEGILLSGSEGSEGIVYLAEMPITDFGDKPWIPFYVENPKGFTLPEGVVPFLEFDMENGMIRGFGGVNRFRGSFEMSAEGDLKVGPLASTMMAGPGMDYEGAFLSALDRADCVLGVRGLLFFYRGTEIVAAFRSGE